ncbi:unnamed protein product, partial [Porites lobata]
MRGPVLWLQHTSSTPDTSTRRPVCPQCFRAHLHPVYSDTALYTQLLYFSRLFDYDHAVKNAKTGVSSVFGKRKSRLRAIGSRNGPWERLALTQRTLER